MGFMFKVTLEGPKDAPDFSDLVERVRQVVRVAGRRAVQYARLYAPGSRLKNQIDYIENELPTGAESLVMMPEGLKFTLPPGTKAHTIPGGVGVAKSEAEAIQRQKGYPLRFYWERGPQGPRVYSFWAVEHPGYEPKDDWGLRVMDATEVVLDQELEELADYISARWQGTVGIKHD